MSLKTKPIEVTNNLKAKVLMKNWLSNQDIMILAECGTTKSSHIKRDIQKQILEEGFKLPGKKVPKKRVLEHLGIDENYIFKLAQTEQKLGLANISKSTGEYSEQRNLGA